MPSPTPPPPLPDPEDDRRLAERRRRAATARQNPTTGTTGTARSRSSSSRTAPPAPPARSNAWTRTPPRVKAIGIAVGIVLVVVLVGTFIGRRSSGGSSTIETDDAVSAMQSMLDGVDHDTELDGCPFGTVRSIAADVGDDITFPVTPVEATPMILMGDETKVDEVLCAAGTPDDRWRTGRTLYVYATPAPTGSYSDYLTRLLDGAEVDLEPPRKHAGGTIYAWCTTPSDEFRGGCGADWVAADGGVVVGLQVAGGEITAAQVTSALEHELAALVERFAAEVPTSSPATTGPVQTVGSAPASTPERAGTTDTG